MRYFCSVITSLSLLVLGQGMLAQSPVFKESVPNTEIEFELATIPGGSFRIGSPGEEELREDDEGPQKVIRVDSFWMGTTEVTFDLYEVFRERKLDSDSARGSETYSADAATRPSPPYEDPTFGMGKYGYPAVSMTQYAALQFCKWLSEKTGRFYRLPTEAEWEYACRAGSKSAYAFGDDPEELDSYGWYYENSDGAYHPVASLEPNDWGLYDMHGNVAEWCLDQYQADYWATLEDSVANPWRLPDRLHPRTVRGGSWDDDAEELRSANRIRSSMEWKRRDPQLPKSFWWNTDSPFVGFRLVSPIPQPSPEEAAKFWRMTLDE